MEIAESPQGLIAESNSREKAIDIDHLRTNSNLKNEGISQPVPSKSAGLRGTWRKVRDRREPLLTAVARDWRGGCAALAETG